MRASKSETIIKKFLPYLERRGADLPIGFSHEEPAILDTDYKKGFIDILVTLGKKTPMLFVEAKRGGVSKRLKYPIHI